LSEPAGQRKDDTSLPQPKAAPAAAIIANVVINTFFITRPPLRFDATSRAPQAVEKNAAAAVSAARGAINAIFRWRPCTITLAAIIV
jgi:hypothetical protein